MTYLAFKSAIAGELKKHRTGRTWKELQSSLKLSYKQPCPEWLRQMEDEIGLVREKGAGRALSWRVRKT